MKENQGVTKWDVEDLSRHSNQTKCPQGWILARPYGWNSIWIRIRYAILVLRCKADIVVWRDYQ